jgi:hypothetical protein
MRERTSGIATHLNNSEDFEIVDSNQPCHHPQTSGDLLPSFDVPIAGKNRSMDLSAEKMLEPSTVEGTISLTSSQATSHSGKNMLNRHLVVVPKTITDSPYLSSPVYAFIETPECEILGKTSDNVWMITADSKIRR